MKNYSSLLVPVDFSNCSMKSVDYGVDFGLRYGAVVHLLFVVEPIETFVSINGMEQSVYVDMVRSVREQGEIRLNGLAAELRGKGLSVVASVCEGKPSEEILDYAKKNAIELICISTHGRSGLNHFLLGSTTERILRKAECPVFVIRTKE
ncbi:MAG: universal stress protein [Candidatus Kapabacteria bacterium]|nr:universal stress protein [Candidatus Kapabacteria bacterium]